MIGKTISEQMYLLVKRPLAEINPDGLEPIVRLGPRGLVVTLFSSEELVAGFAQKAGLVTRATIEFARYEESLGALLALYELGVRSVVLDPDPISKTHSPIAIEDLIEALRKVATGEVDGSTPIFINTKIDPTLN